MTELSGMDNRLADLEADCSDLVEDLDQSQAQVAKLEKDLHKFKSLGWNPERGSKLRRLETFYSRFTNIMIGADNKAPNKIIQQLLDLATQELKYLPENPWNDKLDHQTSEEGSLQTISSGDTALQQT